MNPEAFAAVVVLAHREFVLQACVGTLPKDMVHGGLAICHSIAGLTIPIATTYRASKVASTAQRRPGVGIVLSSTYHDRCHRKQQSFLKCNKKQTTLVKVAAGKLGRDCR